MHTSGTRVAAAQTPSGITSAVLLEVIVHGPAARSTLAMRLDCSQAQVSRVVAPLIRSGLLRELEPARDETAGRPLVPLGVHPDALHFLGIKITRDRAYVTVIDLQGQLLHSWSAPIVKRSPTDVVAVLAELASEASTHVSNLRGVGVSLGGQTTDGRVVQRASFLGWRDLALADQLEASIGLPVVVENDVRALTRAEHWFGQGKGLSSFALLTVGAGVGLGVVVNNAVITGASTGAGAVGHQLIPDSDAVCELGHRGCLRALVATDFIEQRVSTALGRPVLLEEVIGLAKQGEGAATEAARAAARAVGTLIGDIANVVDPGRVVISGEGAGLLGHCQQDLHDALVTSRHWASTVPEVIIADFDFTEWARGAAVSAMQSMLLGPELASFVVEAEGLTVSAPSTGLPVTPITSRHAVGASHDRRAGHVRT